MKQTSCNQTALSLRSVAAAHDQKADRAHWLSVVAIMVAFVLAAVFVGQANGQVPRYKIKTYENAALIDANLKEFRTLAEGFARAKDDSKFTATQKGKIQAFYKEYIPAKLTQYQNPEQMNEMMGIVNTALMRSLRAKPGNYVQLGRWLFPEMVEISEGNYHPAARINAVQFVSQTGRSTAQGFTIPHPMVLKQLLPLYQDKNSPDAVIAAVLQGMERFTRFNLPSRASAETKQLYGVLSTEMKQLLDAPVPVGRDEMAHAFLKRYAVSILSNLAADGSLGKQLISISTNDQNPNLLALHSAAAVASLPSKMQEGDVEHDKVLKQWANRILDAYGAEITRIESLSPSTTGSRSSQPPPPERYLKTTTVEEEAEKPRRPGMGMGMEMGMEMDMEMMGMEEEMMGMDEMMGGEMMGMGMGMGMMNGFGQMAANPQPAEVVASRRQLNYVIQQILLGVTGEAKTYEDVAELKPTGGLIVATPAESVTEVQDWLTSIYEVTTALNDPTLDNQRSFLKGLKEQVVLLEELIDSYGKEKKAEPNAVPGGLDDPLAQFGIPANANPAQPNAVQPNVDALNEIAN